MTAPVSSELHNTVTEELISARLLWTAVLLNAIADWRNGTLRAKRRNFSLIAKKISRWFAPPPGWIPGIFASSC